MKTDVKRITVNRLEKLLHEHYDPNSLPKACDRLNEAMQIFTLTAIDGPWQDEAVEVLGEWISKLSRLLQRLKRLEMTESEREHESYREQLRFLDEKDEWREGNSNSRQFPETD